jgi:hypothetical protein
MLVDRLPDEPEHGRPEPDEQGPSFGISALVLSECLGANPKTDAQSYRAEAARL